MSDDNDKKPSEEGEERTVFMPGGTVPPGSAVPADSGEAATTPPTPDAAAPAEPEPVQPAPTPEPAAEAPAGEPEAAPAAPESAAPAAEAPAAPSGTSVPPSGTSARSETSAGQTGFAPREGARAIQVGDCLNHIFEVKRFLARGGMGEVFEGCNINTDERVAIKVMLPALAADEKVVAMFRKEARTLTKLNHDALVAYRVLAQEPQLGALYIVTEFIEGVELGEVLGKVERTPDELAGLLRRLASGLGAAHKLGAIHRDMSPDNVLLPGGDVHQAKIIDFGIAKDLDASSATIVGDGFAGKLNYVAPEQLGDYGRDVGPWTDVYSLALVILAVANGKNVNMSGSLVDAIDKRRKGPDTSAIPANLKPVIEAMLRPDPKDRLRSMDEVVAMLDGRGTAPPVAPTPPVGVTSTPAPAPSGSSKALIAIGVIVTLLVAAGGAWYLMRDVVPTEDPTNNQVVVQPGNPVATARSAVNSVLPSVGCTWLDIGDVRPDGDRLLVAMRGVAGDPEAAQRELNQALTQAGIRNARLDFGDVAPITAAGCAALDTYRQARSNVDLLTVAQPRFEMVMQPAGTPYANEAAANAVININLGNPSTQFAVLGIEPSGTIQRLIADRAEFESRLAQSVNGRPITAEGNDRYRLNIDLDHTGWSGIMLVTGTGPFPEDIVSPPIGARGPAWQQRFLAAAAERGWRVEMVWFESVNREADTVAPPTNQDGVETPPAEEPPPPPPADDGKPTE